MDDDALRDSKVQIRWLRGWLRPYPLRATLSRDQVLALASAHAMRGGGLARGGWRERSEAPQCSSRVWAILCVIEARRGIRDL